MPKPRTEARDQRRAARDLARRQAIAAVEAIDPPLILTPEVVAAYTAELERIVERMRMQYRLRADLAPLSDLAPSLAPSDRPAAPGSDGSE